ncbi:putative peptidoglycan binding protein [Hasllibacter halocynthiae]|uniref:Putative peptidoglycan binding protein n=1 Tax=Hasllibacter halocynthiae TaxID=595589 RepID=A0A2T0X6H6_9RHOB|nr:peptidoglycan-binding domain-containing protein [Hasllibacter halocynthiae]PRY94474.1 putative peptidoglycan binding protein [Hasllibacter halocynthiae]
MRALVPILAAALAVAACGPGRGPAPGSPLGPEVRREARPIGTIPAGPGAAGAIAPPGADPALCWDRAEDPARVVSRSVQVRMPGGGLVTRTRQRIAQARRDVWFETPCAPALTAELVASLQRALTARGLYDGRIDGAMDDEVRRAVLAFQAPRGLAAGTLSMEAARALGLVPVAAERQPGTARGPATDP